MMSRGQQTQHSVTNDALRLISLLKVFDLLVGELDVHTLCYSKSSISERRTKDRAKTSRTDEVEQALDARGTNDRRSDS